MTREPVDERSGYPANVTGRFDDAKAMTEGWPMHGNHRDSRGRLRLATRPRAGARQVLGVADQGRNRCRSWAPKLFTSMTSTGLSATFDVDHAGRHRRGVGRFSTQPGMRGLGDDIGGDTQRSRDAGMMIAGPMQPRSRMANPHGALRELVSPLMDEIGEYRLRCRPTLHLDLHETGQNTQVIES